MEDENHFQKTMRNTRDEVLVENCTLSQELESMTALPRCLKLEFAFKEKGKKVNMSLPESCHVQWTHKGFCRIVGGRRVLAGVFGETCPNA